MKYFTMSCLVMSFVCAASVTNIKEKRIIIPARLDEPGFFSAFNSVLGALDFCDKSHCKEISIDMGEVGLYYEPSHGPNWWSYYFEPIDAVVSEACEIATFTLQELFDFSRYAALEMPLRRAHELIQKYVHLRPHILKRIEDFYCAKFVGYYVIGVHYRGTDKGAEVPLVDLQEVWRVLQRIIKEHACYRKVRVFLATDDLRCLRFLQSELKKQLIFIDTMRSETMLGSHMNREEGSPYQKGEDALVDCVLLSRCDLLLKTASNLSDCSRQFNPDIPVIHLSKTPGDCH